MAYFIKGTDKYINPDDLYVKRGYDWNMSISLPGTLWDFNSMKPCMIVETQRAYAFARGSFGINFNVSFNGEATQATTVCGRWKCRLKIGKWTWGATNDTDEPAWLELDRVRDDAYFYIAVGDKTDIASEKYHSSGEPLQRHEIPVIGSGVEGHQIPIPQEMEGKINGKVRFELIHYQRQYINPMIFYNVGSPIRGFSIKFARYDSELRDEKNTYVRKIDDSLKDKYEVSCNFCTPQQNNPFSDHPVFNNNGSELEKLNCWDGMGFDDAMVMEEYLADRIYKMYNRPRSQIKINIKFDSSKTYNPMYTYTYNGNIYRIISANHNWQNDTVELTLQQL